VIDGLETNRRNCGGPKTWLWAVETTQVSDLRFKHLRVPEATWVLGSPPRLGILSYPWASGPPIGMKVASIRAIDSKWVDARLPMECNPEVTPVDNVSSREML
jgi:hypothetical protein